MVHENNGKFTEARLLINTSNMLIFFLSRDQCSMCNLFMNMNFISQFEEGVFIDVTQVF